jgi:iron complex outermembrane receptor protein
MDELLRALLPSYNVSNHSIDDAATITRPANLRGLPPDNTLVLINGKRHHRSSVIAELGGSLAAGAQGPDVSVIPTMALERVEVLRDGASAQYGSDAIAGVINFVLKEDNRGFSIEGKYGEFYEGDGDSMQLGMNMGLPLGPDGFANVTLQWKEKDPTSRSLQKTNAVNQIATGNTAIIDPVQVWGSPEVKDDWAFMINSGIELSDSHEVYAFGNYAERAVTGGFFFRNPDGRPGVFTEEFDRSNRLIFDLNPDIIGAQGQTSNCPVLLSPGRGQTDQSVVDADRAALAALPENCWVANNIFPGGYTPSFGGDVEDIGGVVGVRGEWDNGLGYDFSINLGRNESSYRISNTWNPSLGPDSPTAFNLGKYRQTDQSYNADFTYPMAVDAFYSDLNIAFGAEYRVETFQIEIGDIPSWEGGDFTFQGDNFHSDGVTPLLSPVVGAHGFAGFSPEQAGEWDRANYAIYTDMEADVIESLTLGAAVRYEDFDDFGDTLNGKLAARWQIVPRFAIRGSYSTGFRAPTPGQSNVTKISTVTVDGELQQRGQIPPTNPIAAFLGAEPLKEEEAENYTLGLVWDATDNLTFTLDWYRIELQDRIAQTGTIDITAVEAPDGVGCDGALPGDPNLPVNQCLQLLGVPGASTLSSVSFFTNDFETTTEGVDLIGTYVQDWGDAGITNFTVAWNWTKTSVDDAGEEVSRDRVLDLERYNPRNRGTFTANHTIGGFRFLARVSYYDDWTVGDWSSDPTDPGPDGTGYTRDCEQDLCYDGDWLVDLEAAYTFNERYTFVVGAQNAFDTDAPLDGNNGAGPDFSDNSGQKYTDSSHWGINGGFWYLRFRADLM